MPATLRPTRLEVSDRFPMLGFNIRNDGTARRAEVALATDPALFAPENKARRSLDNFYSSRSVGAIALAGTETMYIVPPDVLARFVGKERLYFGLASADAAGPLQVDLAPGVNSPYVSIRSLSNRSMSRVRVLPNRQQRAAGYNGAGVGLEWAGDLARPGMVGTTPAMPGAPAAAGKPPPASHYDDGFGPMPAPAPAAPAAPSAQGLGGVWLAPPPQARGMDGGVSAAIAIGGFLVQSVRDSAGDVTWELDQFAHIKHPNDVAPSPAEPFRDAPTILLNDWPVAGGMVDDISAWFAVDWQYNGKSLGNIRIGNIGTNDAAGWGLHVRAQIMDDNIVYPPNQAAALRIRLHYRFHRGIGSDVIAVTDLHLFGDGNVRKDSRWLQAEVLEAAPLWSAQGVQGGYPQAMAAPAPHPARARARALDGGDGTSFEFKYRMFIPSPLIDGPTGVFGGDGRSFSYASGTSRGELVATVRLTPGGGIAGIDYQNRHWGESTEYHSSDTFHVEGKPDWWLDKNHGAQPINRATLAVSDDNLKLIAGVTAGMQRSVEAMAEQASIVTLVAAGSLPLSSVAPAIDADVSLFVRLAGGQLQVKVVGEHDGFPCHELYVNRQRVYRYDPLAVGNGPTALMPPMDIEARTGWITIGNSSAQALAEEPLALAPPPPPVARALGGPLAAAGAIAGFVAETVRDHSGGDVSWELDQWNHVKHPNDVAPTPSAGMRNAPQIRLDSWPVAGGIADDISAWFTIDWQYNGLSLGNVRIRNAGTNDSIGWGLQVTAKVGDDNEVHQPSGCAGLFINFEYRFTRSVGSDVIAQTDIHLFGDGTYTQESRWIQASMLALEDDTPARVNGSDGNVSWSLAQHPAMRAPAGMVAADARVPSQPIVLNEWPYLDEEGGARSQLGLTINWATDGAGGVGAVTIAPSGILHRDGRALAVNASISDGPQMTSLTSLEVLIQYTFSHPNEADQVATTSIMLNGNGTAQQKSKWLGQAAPRMAA